MAKTLFFLGIIPVILGIAARKWFGERLLRPHRDVHCQLDCAALAEGLCAAADIPNPSLTGRRNQAGAEEVALSRELAPLTDRISLAETGLLVGLALLARRQPELLAWRYSCVKFSWAFPAFTLLVVIFAALSGSLMRWALPISALALAFGTFAGWLVVWIDWQAASLTAALLEKRAIVAREDDRLAITKAMRAFAAKRFVPGMLSLLFPESTVTKEKQ